MDFKPIKNFIEENKIKSTFAVFELENGDIHSISKGDRYKVIAMIEVEKFKLMESAIESYNVTNTTSPEGLT